MSSATFTVLLTLLALFVPCALSCPDLWIGMGGSCYKYSNDAMNWFQAEQVHTILKNVPNIVNEYLCLVLCNGRRIPDCDQWRWWTGKEEHHYSFAHYSKNNVAIQASLHTILPSGVSYWIGLADFADEGIYRWQTGYDIAEYTYWFSDQPDAYDSEDCVELVRTTNRAQHSI